MKTLILPLLLSLAAPAAAAQPARRQQPQQVRLPNQRQRVVVLPVRRPQHLRVQSCGIGRWVDGVFTAQPFRCSNGRFKAPRRPVRRP